MEQNTDLKLFYQVFIEDGGDRCDGLEISFKGGAKKRIAEDIEFRDIPRIALGI